jgi:multidrug efflux pump subunit AcrB
MNFEEIKTQLSKVDKKLLIAAAIVVAVIVMFLARKGEPKQTGSA